MPESGRAGAGLLLTILVTGVLVVLVVVLREGNPRAAAEHRTELVESSAEEKPVAVADELGVRTPAMLARTEDVGEPTRPRMAAAENPARLGALAERAGRMPPMGDPEHWRESMQRLQRGQDDATRLAAAREILADETAGPLKLRALDVLSELDPTSVADELHKLAAGAADDPRQSALVMSALQSLGSRAGVLSAPDLTAFYESGSKEVQLAAASALAARGDESLSLKFQEQRKGDLAHADPQVRAAAVRDLGQVHSQTSLALLVPLLADKSDEVRMAALSAVAQSDDPSVLEQIRPLVNDSSELVRRMATRMVEMRENRLARGREGERPLGPLLPRPSGPR